MPVVAPAAMPVVAPGAVPEVAVAQAPGAAPLEPPAEPLVRVVSGGPASPAVPRGRAWSGRRLPVAAGWLVTAVTLAELAYMAVAYSGTITRAWPPAERAYALFGIKP